MKDYKVKHGFCIGGIPKVYSIWGMLIQRCHNPKNKNYKDYGLRGIYVCDEWRSDSGAFIRWALENGYKEGLQIDRINNNEGYTPENCRFVTHSINVLNRRKRDDFGIYKKGLGYQVSITRNGENHYIGFSKDIYIARKMKQKFLNKLD